LLECNPRHHSIRIRAIPNIVVLHPFRRSVYTSVLATEVHLPLWGVRHSIREIFDAFVNKVKERNPAIYRDYR